MKNNYILVVEVENEVINKAQSNQSKQWNRQWIDSSKHGGSILEIEKNKQAKLLILDDHIKFAEYEIYIFYS